jgi:hypothetical protein
MPPQQGERLLDVVGEVDNLGAHEASGQRCRPVVITGTAVACSMSAVREGRRRA